MNMTFSEEELAFRDEVRDFLGSAMAEDADYAAEHGPLSSKEDMLSWHRILHKKGWVAPGWPEEFGGTGWSSTERYIWNEECARAGTKGLLPFGLNMVGPVIYTFGDEQQKQRFLPRILSGEDWWCQGYSEPGAGSDLAGLRTKAVRDGDDYIITGHKTWTTLAQHADWIFCLCKTGEGAKDQESISFILVDMKSPGVTVRPIITLEGGHEVNDVFLDEVHVPVANRIGEENRGWTYAKFLLSNERSGIAGVARSKRAIERLKEIARSERVDGLALIETGEFARDVSEIEIELSALEVTELRTLAAERTSNAPRPESSILKIKGTEIQQNIAELTMKAVGHYSFPYRPTGHDGFDMEVTLPGPEYAHTQAQNFLSSRKSSIFGGSNEIQRNIISKAVLGL